MTQHNDPKKRVVAIDNGGAFSTDAYRPLERLKRTAIAPFDPEFIKGIKNADENHLSELFDRVAAHPDSRPPRWNDTVDDAERDRRNGFMLGNFERGTPEEAKQQFLERLRDIKNGFEKGILTPQQMHRYLAEGIAPGDPHDNEHGNTRDNTFNNTHNNTNDNTHNNQHNNTNDNTHNNYWNNTHDNKHNNTHDNSANNTENQFVRDTQDWNREPPQKQEQLDNETPRDWEAARQRQREKEEEARQIRIKQHDEEQKAYRRNRRKEELRQILEQVQNGGSDASSLKKMWDDAQNPKS